MGGAFSELLALSWANEVSGHIDQEANLENVDWDAVLSHRPLSTADVAMGRSMPLYRDWLAHSTMDRYWQPLRFTAKDFAGIDIPTLTLTGWFDTDQPGALVYWRGLMADAPHRDRHALVVGPWRHRADLLFLIGHDSRRPAPNPRVSTDQRLPVLRAILFKVAAVHYPRNYFSHVVLFAGARRKHPVDAFFGIRRRFRFFVIECRPRRRRDFIHQGAQPLDTRCVVRLPEIHRAADLRVHLRSAQIFR